MSWRVGLRELFATGLDLQATATAAADASVAARIAEAIERLDHMIVRRRRHVFALGSDQVNAPGSSAG
jgi:hypothetical protein